MRSISLQRQHTGKAAGLAIIAAILGYASTFRGHPFLGLFAEVIAIIAGAIGLLMAASPRVSGGMLSIAAILLGVMGIAVAILGMIGRIIF